MIKTTYPWVCVFKRTTRPFFIYESCRDGMYGRYDVLLIYIDKRVRVYLKEEQLESHANELLSRAQENPSILEEYKVVTRSLHKEAIEWAREIASRDVSTLSREDLLSVIETLNKYYREIGQTILGDHVTAENRLIDKLSKMARPDETDADVWYTLLAIAGPIEPSEELVEEMRLLKLAVKARNRRIQKKVNEKLEELRKSIRRGRFELSFAEPQMFHAVKLKQAVIQALSEDEYLAGEIKKHVFDYAWIRSEYGEVRQRQEDYFLDRIAEYLTTSDPGILLKEVSMQADLKRWLRNRYLRECYRREPEFRKRYKPYADLISMNAEVRFERRLTYTQMDNYTQPALSRIIGIYNEQYPNEPLKENNLYSALLSEIADFLRTGQKLETSRLRSRENFWVCSIQGGSIVKNEVGEAARHYVDCLIQEQQIDHPPAHPRDLSKGIVRIPSPEGVIQGPARLVVSIEDAERIQTGDILVSYMALPAYQEHFGKLKGIVTDNGSMTCHALTLSQELAWKYGFIPLVTDVEWVADVIKDGELIEVDTNTGRVKSLERE
jgi:phosphohistidine swiveling domain-containing protein